jgi:glycosyltransferase involved in cell wall biosynthesis
MNKYSVIIPTLWQSPRIHKLLSDLIASENVDEIILIDNSGKFFEYYEALDKVKLVQPKENLYIAASWNLGVELSKNEYIAVVNDDVNFNPIIFQLVGDNVEGIVGQATGNYYNNYTEMPFIAPLVQTRPWGWASFFMLQKKYWQPIPEELRIWYNDDWIVRINSNPKWVLHNFSVQTEMSSTIGEGKFEDIKLQDREHWDTILQKHYSNK